MFQARLAAADLALGLGAQCRCAPPRCTPAPPAPLPTLQAPSNSPLMARLFLLCCLPGALAFGGQSTWRGETQRGLIRMDDEVARAGIKVELTTREDYLETRFTKLSASGHDLTPMLKEEVLAWQCEKQPSDIAHNAGLGQKGLYCAAVGGLPIFASGDRKDSECSATELVFSSPCDEEHVKIEIETGDFYCARSGIRIGTVSSQSPQRRFRVNLTSNQSLRFHSLQKPFPVESQPESYWGSEDQFTYRRQVGSDE